MAYSCVYQFYGGSDVDFVTSVETNARRYSKLFSSSADDLMPPPSSEDIEFDNMDEFLEQVCTENIELMARVPLM